MKTVHILYFKYADSKRDGKIVCENEKVVSELLIEYCEKNSVMFAKMFPKEIDIIEEYFKGNTEESYRVEREVVIEERKTNKRINTQTMVEYYVRSRDWEDEYKPLPDNEWKLLTDEDIIQTGSDYLFAQVFYKGIPENRSGQDIYNIWERLHKEDVSGYRLWDKHTIRVVVE